MNGPRKQRDPSTAMVKRVSGLIPEEGSAKAPSVVAFSFSQARSAPSRHTCTLLSMERVRLFFRRLGLRRRPPAGPLTTAETTAAGELHQETVVKDRERAERKQEKGS
jgi:hypothetical protein